VRAAKRYEEDRELGEIAALQEGMDIFIVEVDFEGGPGAWGRCEKTKRTKEGGQFRIQFASQCVLWQESVRNAGFAFGWESDVWYEFENFHVFPYRAE
jgi:hypothetical protein